MLRKSGAVPRTPTRTAGLAGLLLLSNLAFMSGIAARASADAPEDPIIIPDGAKEVDYINRFGQSTWSTLNTHMIVAKEGARSYLLVFDKSCRNLTRPGAKMEQGFREGRLNVRSIVEVDKMPCQIDHIYSITDDDAAALRKQLQK